MKGIKTNFSIVAIFAIIGSITPAMAANYDVTVSNDNGTGGTANTLSWAIMQANQNAGADTITDVTITGVMKTLLNSDITIKSDSTKRKIDGNNQYRPLFIKSGTVVIENVTIEKGLAKGGDSRYGGGGAGLGGALFMYGGNVTIRDVDFKDNNATGGSSGVSGGYYAAGGGGIFGNADGPGGGGMFAPSTDSNGGYGGNGNYGGGAGAYGGDENGSFGGGGAYGGYYNQAGNGGFGGGGGFGYYTNGGNGGFAGGGGASNGDSDGDSSNKGGNGGFGGGSGPGSGGNGSPGYGGGNADSGESKGGGGAGLGGAIFAMKGTMTLEDVSFSNNVVEYGKGGNNGQADAKDVYICTSDQDPNCGATVNRCGTTATNEVNGTFGTTCPTNPTEKAEEDSFAGGGGCTYNPNAKGFDAMYLFMMFISLFYIFRSIKSKREEE